MRTTEVRNIEVMVRDDGTVSLFDFTEGTDVHLTNVERQQLRVALKRPKADKHPEEDGDA